MNWKKLSIVSIWFAGITAILETFFGKYLPGHALSFLIIDGLAVLVFIISEIMKFITKSTEKRSKNE